MGAQSQFNTNKFRNVFDMRLGEIIENVLGDDRIRQLFDNAGSAPEDNTGKPVGLIAMDMGVITQDTKTALLVAQAAERTARLADKTIKTAKNDDIIKHEDDALHGYVSHDDDVFKYVGSSRDPEALRTAQATWQIAQITLNTEILSHRGYPDLHTSPGNEAAYGLKQAAVNNYKQAASMLEREGHAEASEKLYECAADIAKQIPEGTYPTPGTTAQNLIDAETNDVAQLNMWAERDGSPSVGAGPQLQTLEKLKSVVNPAATKQQQQVKRQTVKL